MSDQSAISGVLEKKRRAAFMASAVAMLLGLTSLAGFLWAGGDEKPDQGRIPHLLHALASMGNPETARAGFGDVLTAMQFESTVVGRWVGHEETVLGLIFSSDGKAVASADYGGTVILWDAETGRQLSRFERSGKRSVFTMAFSPDGGRIAMPDDEGAVIVRDVRSGEIAAALLGVYKDPADLRELLFSPDGRMIAASDCQNSAVLWDAETGKMAGEPWTGRHLAFSPDSRFLASVEDHAGVVLRDAKTGRPAGQAMKGYEGEIRHLVFSPDGRTLAASGGGAGLILWDAESGDLAGEPLRGRASSADMAVFSPDGKILAVSNGELWDAAGGRLLGTLEDAAGLILPRLIFSPDSRRIVSSSCRFGQVLIWDAATRQRLTPLRPDHQGSVLALSISPDGKNLVSAGLDQVIVSRRLSGEQALSRPLKYEPSAESVAFSPDGKTLISTHSGSEGGLTVRDVGTGLILGEPWPGARPEGFSADGANVVIKDDQGALFQWNAAAGQKLPVDSAPMPLKESFRQSASPDGALRTTDDTCGTVIVQDAKTLEVLFTLPEGHYGQVGFVGFSPDGKTLISSGSDKAVILWDVESGQVIGKPLRDFEELIRYAAFSPDGQKFALAGPGASVTVWDAAARQMSLPPLLGHKEPVAAVAFNSDGSRVISTDQGGVTLQWDAATGKRLPKAPKKRPEYARPDTAESPDGKTIANIVPGGGNIEIWDKATYRKKTLPKGRRFDGRKHATLTVFSADGQKIVTAGGPDKAVTLWNISSGQGRMIGLPMHGHEEAIIDVALSPDGKTIATASWKQAVILWDVESGRMVMEPRVLDRRIRWDPAGSQTAILFSSPEGHGSAIIEWGDDVVTPRIQLKYGHGGGIAYADFSPDGRRIALASGNGVEMLDQAGQVLGEPFQGHTDMVHHLAFGWGGNKLVSAGADASVIVWDAETGRMLGEPLRGDDRGFFRVAVSPHDQLIAAAAENRIILWDMATSQRLGSPLTGHSEDISHLTFNPRGNILVSESRNEKLVWDVDPESLRKKGCALAGRNLTCEEWREARGDQPYQKACEEWPAPTCR